MRFPSLSAFALVLLFTAAAQAQQFDPQPHLEKSIIGPALALEEVMTYCERRVPGVPKLETAEAWKKFETETREKTLRAVVFRGEAANWRSYKGKVEWTDEKPVKVAAGSGYRVKKLRFEAVPGMWIPGVLYEPEKFTGKAPVFLNVNGHDKLGKAADYKQIRCINQAKRGIISLNLEWVGMGQLRSEGFGHAKMNQLDLCGTSGVSPFYLSMSRAIDILLEHPHGDPARVGVAGLSGGGWQTIFISALDTRVTLSNPVAGYASFVTRSRRFADLGDSEQTPVDLGMHADYAVLTAMLAPRPALLTFNATDNCCFAAPTALPPLLDAARPAYRLFDKELNLRSHVNYVPGDHNFGLENREAHYRMIGDFFYPGDKTFERSEISCESEVKSSDDLLVPLPEQNESFNSLALKLSESLPRTDKPGTREDLRQIVRAKTYQALAQTDGEPQDIGGIRITRRRFKLDDVWTLPSVEFAPAGATGTLVLIADKGRTSTAELVKTFNGAGLRVVTVDPYYFGESKLGARDWLFSLLVSTVGDRPLGIQASQVAAVGRWAKKEYPKEEVTLLAVGPRTSVVAVVAGALEPETFAAVEKKEGLASLKSLIRENKSVNESPELFCFGLLERFDIPELKALGPKRR